MNTLTQLAADTLRTLDDLPFGRVITTAEYRRRGREVITVDTPSGRGDVDRLYEIAEEVGYTYTVPLMALRREAWQVRPDEFIYWDRYRDWMRAGYDNSTRRQNLTQPATHMPTIPIGTWRIDAEDWNSYGYAVFQLRWLHPDDLQPTENGWKYERRHYVKKYAEWRRDGLVPPPIEVVETIRQNLRITNGHRR